MTFFTNLLYRFAQLIGGAFENPKMLWIAMPLIITLIVVELYFKKYKDEEIGWNTALTNALVLFFVALNLFQVVFTYYQGTFWNRLFSTGFFISLIILIMGVVLFLADFFHKIPKKVAFLISSHLFINTTAYVAIVIVYNGIPLDLATIVAWIILVVLLKAIFLLVRLLEPKSMKFDLHSLKSKSNLKK
ncbi:MAG: hypothetical protein KKF46_02455 [Nanoarchaeota archaeon]|nr:hypothetical protein [Nanoarchaeota archaeon]MBU1321194.1 hypothetical protein [Nanoarchaeota archaeon]MBU1598462.1 hypothetical protein [Nanoarchaeota archaeon]MBU2441395.1 hypothetical protein [Nanoarchaeota archaeon]